MRLCLDEALPLVCVLTARSLYLGDSHSGREYAVRGIKRGYRPEVSDLCASESHSDHWKGKAAVARNLQCFFQTIGLALNAVDQYAEHVLFAKSTHLKDVTWWIISP